MEHEIRTYGGWRRRRGIGLMGLDSTATFTVMGAALVLVIVAAFDEQVLLYLAPPVLLAGGLGLIRVSGVSLARLALARCRWWWASWRGYTRYRAGIVVDHPRAFQLPGVLAPLELLSAEDGYCGTYGIVWEQHTGLLTATLKVVPSSTWLADRADADAWVASWGSWLAALGHLPAVRWVTVTVETAPEPGSTLTQAVQNIIDPSAPETARRILTEVAAAAPATAADVQTRVSITFDPAATPANPKNLTEAIGELTRTIDAMAGALGNCGVTVLGRASATDISAACRAAFDPHSRGDVAALLEQPGRAAELLTWADAGPVAATEHTDFYEHDGGISVSWGWHEPPRQNVHSDILACLVAPSAHAKRVTLQYRALSAAAASRVLQQEVNAASFRAQLRRRSGRDETARDAYDSARARQAAAEEAMGAGVCLVSMYVTVTVTDPEQLPRAVANVEAAADSSKVRLRRLWGSQAAAFATGLPCGIAPAELSHRLIH